MYPYTNNNQVQQHPLNGLNLHDPQVRNWVMQYYPQYANLLPPVQAQQQPQFVPPPPQYQQQPQQFQGQQQYQNPLQGMFAPPMNGFQGQPTTMEGQAVMALFEEFAKTEDGKLLVSYLGKFNSYCQSMLAKSNNTNT